jgi:hypothetical protein
MQVKPIEGPETRKEIVSGIGVRHVADQHAHVVHKTGVLAVAGLKFHEDCSRYDKVPIVIVVVIVARVAEVCSEAAIVVVALSAGNPTPILVIIMPQWCTVT